MLQTIKMEEQQVTMKDLKKIAVGKTLTEYNHKKEKS